MKKGGFDTFTLDDYIITEKGEVFNKKWGRFVKPQPNGTGYLRVHIAGKMYFVESAVWHVCEERQCLDSSSYCKCNNMGKNCLKKRNIAE